jgi:isopentenyl diphosphate isomerase/L-lactate dehydrogenase-like FMN-dependent dehydrogenase
VGSNPTPATKRPWSERCSGQGRFAWLVTHADAVGQPIEIVLDGGVSRGSGVVKAGALGARAVMIDA